MARPSRLASLFGALFSLAVIGVMIVILVMWTNQPPPACATDMTPAVAKRLLVGELLKRGYSTSETDTLQVEGIGRQDEDNWPTYFVRFSVTAPGISRHLTAIGNGCGLSEILDLTASASTP